MFSKGTYAKIFLLKQQYNVNWLVLMLSRSSIFFNRRVLSALKTANQSLFYRATSQSVKQICHPIPSLEMLNSIVDVSANNGIDLSKVALIGAQHNLETTATLYESIIALGADPKNMFFTGKCYSTSQEVSNSIRALGINLYDDANPSTCGSYEKETIKRISFIWRDLQNHLHSKGNEIDTILVLDDGARVFESMPPHLRLSGKYKVAGVEQTRGGLIGPAIQYTSMPIVEVASSAAKTIIEPPLISEAILSNLSNVIDVLEPNKETIFGVIGNGAIGSAIVKYLVSKGFDVIVYDDKPSSFNEVHADSCLRMKSVESVIYNANFIFGCTGRDITDNINVFELMNNNKIFISCTSEEKEFLSLLKEVSRRKDISCEGLSDIQIETNNEHILKIKNRGFPFNFNRKPWNVPARDIEMTQGLLLGAVIEAYIFASRASKDGVTENDTLRLALNPYIQRFVANAYLSRDENVQRYDPLLISKFNDVYWIQNNSGGIYNDQDNRNLMLRSIFEENAYTLELEKEPSCLPLP